MYRHPGRDAGEAIYVRLSITARAEEKYGAGRGAKSRDQGRRGVERMRRHGTNAYCTTTARIRGTRGYSGAPAEVGRVWMGLRPAGGRDAVSHATSFGRMMGDEAWEASCHGFVFPTADSRRHYLVGGSSAYTAALSVYAQGMGAVFRLSVSSVSEA